MPTTRSSAKKQTKIDGFQSSAEQNEKQSSSTSSSTKSKTKANTAVKRKASSQDDPAKPLNKKIKSNEDQEDKDIGQDHKPIKINRSPVLQLWGAVIAQFIHPDEPWQTCLSIGGSIASLCAISKGRAIGKINPSTETSEDRRAKQADKKTRDLEVMGFRMQIRDGVVNVNGKPKPLSEKALEGKYGGNESYQRVRRAMQEALESWADDKEKLEKEAFHMYEDFRPASGGWGQKGKLDLEIVQKTIARK